MLALSSLCSVEELGDFLDPPKVGMQHFCMEAEAKANRLGLVVGNELYNELFCFM